MIEIRIPTPDKRKLKLLNKFGGEEGFEAIDWGSFTYIELPKYKLSKLKKLIAENKITIAEEIEEVESIDIPVNPIDKLPLFINFLKEKRVDFTIIPSVKLPKNNDALIDALAKFCDENNIWDEPP